MERMDQDKVLTIRETIHDLRELGEYIESEIHSIPMCIPRAIEILEALELIKEG